MDKIIRAVRAIGSQVALAKLLNVNASLISQWVTGRLKVAAHHCLAIERATGVSRYDLRPDVFGSDSTRMNVNSALDAAQHSLAQNTANNLDLCISKRALRVRLGFTNDKQLATVLGLPLAQVESWEEERALPAVPEVLRLLGVQAQAIAEAPPTDPDDNRIVPVEVA